MKIFNKIKDKCLDIINVFKQIKLDKQYYKEYVDGMRSLSLDTESEFAKYDLKISEDRKYITYVARLPNEFGLATDYVIYEKLNELTYFITQYLRNTLGLGSYLSLPEYFHVEDPTNPNVMSTTYLAQWTFQPLIDSDTKKKYFSMIRNGVVYTVLGIAAVFAGIYFIHL